ncbi:deoxyfructose oxidoreductase [Paenibacillus baekrokdamisoli]|uniref:Deoxyfructose oxidoreductase n=1 Tax=Paenibacillus baekrokdamisoli TaxID=1712516 RepID=A0A3G9J6E0_9BACL|nr:Gfo/Idh/MocA family oxidoreductase [Paenibacillus baekrokdamisoli]MBB3072650.1 putative dehydrogenase [Paenibacillus baekrokdamisoli]BBH18934.1 deoxyfructose oxidoreductase [Paenibacillus baekrokdamisoli]
MTRKLRWGVIGCAGIAVGAVIPGIQQSETGEVVAIASREISKAEETAAKLNIPKAYGSYEEILLDKDIDAIYIPLPNHLHMEWSIRAIEAGKHVLCEKPIALNAEQAQRMVDASRAAGVHLAEAFMYRNHPRYERVKEIIASGEIGEVRGMHSVFTFNNAGDSSNVRYRKEWGGGSIYDVGVYPISAARMILGSEPEAVTVHALISPEHDNVDMMASGILEFPGNIALTFDCGMWAAFRNTIEVLGTEGRIEIPEAFVGNPDFLVYTNDGKREEKQPTLNQYSLQADEFALTVWGETSGKFAPEDAIANMKVVDACLTSAYSRTRVLL